MAITKILNCIILGTLTLLCLMVNVSCHSISKFPQSDHFDGKRFFNPGNTKENRFSDMVKWWWEMDTVPWPEWIDDLPQEKPVRSVEKGKLKVTFINHATTLIQMDGLNILTDPIWSDRAGPFSWLGSKRIRKPGVNFNDLPPIDLILISHNHYDHLDIPTLKKLYNRKKSMVITGLGVKKRLLSEGIDNVQDLDWWQNYILKEKGLDITFVPALHSSGRGLSDKNKTLWGGFIIKGETITVYFSGDSGYGDFVKEIKNRFPDIGVSILPLGNYEKRWFMKNQHMNPEEAVKIHRLLGSKQSIGIHYATYLEHPEQAVDAHETDLKKALVKYKIPESEFWIMNFGEGRFVK